MHRIFSMASGLMPDGGRANATQQPTGSSVVSDCNGSVRSARSASDDTISVLTNDTHTSDHKGEHHNNSSKAIDTDNDHDHSKGNNHNEKIDKECSGTPTTFSTSYSESLDSSIPFPTPVTPSGPSLGGQSLGGVSQNSTSTQQSGGDEGSLQRRESRRSRQGKSRTARSDSNDTTNVAALHASMPILTSPTEPSTPTKRPSGFEERMRKRLSERHSHLASPTPTVNSKSSLESPPSSTRSSARPSLRSTRGARSERQIHHSERHERRMTSTGRSERHLTTSERGDRRSWSTTGRSERHLRSPSSSSAQETSTPQASGSRKHSTTGRGRDDSKEGDGTVPLRRSHRVKRSNSVGRSSVPSSDQSSSKPSGESLRGNRTTSTSLYVSEASEPVRNETSSDRRSSKVSVVRTMSSSSAGKIGSSNLGSISESPARRGLSSRRHSSERHLRSNLTLPRLSGSNTSDQIEGVFDLQQQQQEQPEEKQKQENPSEKTKENPLKRTDNDLFNGCVDTNRQLEKKVEKQARLLAEKEEQIRKLLTEQNKAPATTNDSSQNKEEDLEKEIIRTELHQLKATMNQMIQDHDKAEAQLKSELERAQATQPEGGFLHRSKSDDDDRQLVALAAEVRQLQHTHDKALASWKKQLEEARQETATKDAALQQAERRIAELEQQQPQIDLSRPLLSAEGGRKSPPIALSESTLSPTPKASSKLKQGRMQRENVLLQLAQTKKKRLSNKKSFSSNSSGEQEKASVESELQDFGGPSMALHHSTGSEHEEEGSHEKGDKMSKLVKKVQLENKNLRTNLVAKEEEVEKLHLMVSKLQDTEWGMEHDLVKVKEDYELVVDELEGNQLKFERLQEVNNVLNKAMEETEAKFQAMQTELDELKQSDRIRKQREWERKQRDWERKTEQQGQQQKQTQPRSASSCGSDDDETVSVASSSHSAAQGGFLEAAISRRRVPVNGAQEASPSPRRGWGVLSGMLKRDSSAAAAATVELQPPRQPIAVRGTSDEASQIKQLLDENARLKVEMTQMKTHYKEESLRNHQKLAEIRKVFEMHQALAMAAASESN
jgi:hypothetical protein